MTPPVRLALVPLDERPVNVQLPVDVARIAGARIAVPPETLLPSFRTGADLDGLAAWVREQAMDGETSDLLVSLDTLVYGGLIPSRTTTVGTMESLRRTTVLEDVAAARPDLRIDAVSLVMRASNSDNPTEEPAYWKDHGRALHAFGGAVHRSDGEPDVAPLDAFTAAPAVVVEDFSLRRLRNHTVTLRALEMHAAGVLSSLAITADDTAVHSAGSAEQAILRHWLRMIPSGRRVRMYPGADDVGATLVSRSLASRSDRPVRIRAVAGQPDGLALVPPYENQPLSASLRSQVEVAGGVLVDTDPDIVLVLHTPDPDRHDMYAGPPRVVDTAAVDATARAAAAALETGLPVALADVRYPNGADAALADRLLADGALLRLDSYSAWNTSGNSLGSVIALAVAAEVGRRCGTLDRAAQEEALLRRLLDDYVYQSVVRPALAEQWFDSQPGQVPVPRAQEAAVAAHALVAEHLDRWGTGWTLRSLTHPWDRNFEVELTLGR